MEDVYNSFTIFSYVIIFIFTDEEFDWSSYDRLDHISDETRIFS